MVDFDKLNAEKALENLKFEISSALPKTILELLKFSVSADSLFLYIQPDGFLEPDDYGLVKKEVEKNGGNWNRANGRFEVQAPKPKIPEVPADQQQFKEPEKPSPVRQYIEQYCKNCEALSNPCNPKTPLGSYYMNLCLEVRRLRALETVAKNAQQTLDWREEQNKNKPGSRPGSTPSSSAPAPAAPAKKLVDIDGMKTTEETGPNGDYWKAAEVDNPGNERYLQLANEVAAGKQFHEINGKNSYVWLSQTQDWIGFKPCKPRSSR